MIETTYRRAAARLVESAPALAHHHRYLDAPRTDDGILAAPVELLGSFRWSSGERTLIRLVSFCLYGSDPRGEGDPELLRGITDLDSENRAACGCALLELLVPEPERELAP